MRCREVVELVRGSAYFDEAWYLQRYPDVAAAGIDPAVHFSQAGWREGRDPGPDFATSAYLKANADVARAGLNPLVHFLEYGQSEGREVPVHRRKSRPARSATRPVAASAAVYRGRIPCSSMGPWLQSYKLDATDVRLYRAGEWAVGYAKPKKPLDQAFKQLAALSGYSRANAGPLGSAQSPARLADGWFVTDTHLRTRWLADDFPFVVRAYQHNPLGNGSIAMVAERFIQSPLDFCDVNLACPYSPILFAFTDRSGVVLGTRLLAFPSLCRGGAHYPELVAISVAENRSANAIDIGLRLAEQLLIARNSGERLVGAIAVDLSGTDGLSPIDRPEMGNWLARVASVAVERVDGSAATDRLPAEAPTGNAKADDTGTLLLATDMIPTISVLAELGRPCNGTAFFPLIASEPDPAQPAILAALPANAPTPVALHAPGYPASWPRWHGPIGPGANPPFPAGAIRIGRSRPLRDSELLVPASGSLSRPALEAASVTWLIPATDFEAADLVATLRSIAAQSGAISHLIGFIGQPDKPAMDAAARLFRGRVRVYHSLASAGRQAQTSFIGFIRAGVVLHDNRACTLLIPMLDDPAVESAAPALVASEKRGKNWHVSATDLGVVAPMDSDAGIGAGQLARYFWRATFPVVQPPDDLWLAQAATVRGWFTTKDTSAVPGGTHVCTTLLTGSAPSAGRHRHAETAVPAAPEERSLRTRVLFG